MAEYTQWDAIPKSSSNGGEQSEFLKLKSGGTYRIRPVFDPVKFFKYFHKHEGRLRTAICAKPEVCPVRDRHPELKKPSLRYAAYVIDRSDNKVKILEAPQTVFRPIGSSFEATGKNPGSGQDGSDWLVKVTGAGLNTTYEVSFAGQTPLTQEERAALKEALNGDKQKLQKLYKVHTPEEIEERLFGDITTSSNRSDDNASNSDGFGDASTAAPVEPAPVEPAPVEPAPVEPAPPATATDDGDDWENNF